MFLGSIAVPCFSCFLDPHIGICVSNGRVATLYFNSLLLPTCPRAGVAWVGCDSGWAPERCPYSFLSHDPSWQCPQVSQQPELLPTKQNPS